MPFIDDIRTIAKTPEIIELLQKLNKLVEQLDKTKIEGERNIGLVDRAATSAGSSVASPIEGATDAAGGAITGVTNLPNQVPTYPLGSLQTGADSGAQWQNDNNIAEDEERPETDLSKKGGGNSGSAECFIKQANANTEVGSEQVDNAKENLRAAGFGDAEINDFIRRMLQCQPGVHEVNDITNGTAGPPIDTDTNNEDNVAPDYILNGVVGKDPVSGTTIIIKLDGAMPVPNGWTDSETPPVDPSFTSGSLWDCILGGGNRLGQTFDGMCATIVTWAGYGKIYGLDPSATTVSSVTPTPGGYLLHSATLTGNVGDSVASLGGTVLAYVPGPTMNQTYGLKTCVDLSGDPVAVGMCGLTPPLSTSWNTTDSYVVKNVNGKFVGSQYDPVLPSGYQVGAGKSFVDFARDGGGTIRLEFARDGGYLLWDPDGVHDALFYDYNRRLKGTVTPNQVNYYRVTY